MLKSFVLWTGVAVFLAIDACGVGVCAYSATMGKYSDFLDDTPLFLFLKVVVGLGVGALVVVLARNHGNTRRQDAEVPIDLGRSYETPADTYRQHAQENADSEPYPC